MKRWMLLGALLDRHSRVFPDSRQPTAGSKNRLSPEPGGRRPNSTPLVLPEKPAKRNLGPRGADTRRRARRWSLPAACRRRT